MKNIIGKFLYGFSFVVVLPTFLFFWSKTLDKSLGLPVPDSRPIAAIAIALGGFLIVGGMIDLMVFGNGLPMNAFPPKNFVAKGIYRWLSHPIYGGVGLLAGGLSLWLRSPAGLYIVTPVLIMAMISLVLGYENNRTKKIFGVTATFFRPFFSFFKTGRKHDPVIMLTIFSVAAIWALALFYLAGFRVGDEPFFYALVYSLIAALTIVYSEIWLSLKNIAEWVANSRRDFLFWRGRFRIINHALYSGMAGAVAVGIAGYVIGNGAAVLILTICGLLGGALFAQLRWGNPSLLRPYGFWGGIIGGTIGMFLIKIIFDVPISQTLLAGALCIPPAQAVGRLRCLSQGCCHGIVTGPASGIRVWQNQSRVVMLSMLKGQYIHATQLYSILFNVWLTSLLFSLWRANFSPSLVIGLYFILTGIERFTEDAYRGEKQTRMAGGGLQENQLIALAILGIGIMITMLPLSQAIAPPVRPNEAWFVTTILGGLIAAFAMSMDFPKSKIKFSRLSG